MKKVMILIIVLTMLTTIFVGCVKTEDVKNSIEQPTEKAEIAETPKATKETKVTIKPKATVAPKQTVETAPSAEPTEQKKETEKTKATDKTKKTSEPQESKHVHNWKPITETKRVCVSEAYDEPIYEEIEYIHCSCGHDSYSAEESSAHMEEHALKLEVQYSWSVLYKTIQTGTKHHDAVYEDREVTVGYKCECGATK